MKNKNLINLVLVIVLIAAGAYFGDDQGVFDGFDQSTSKHTASDTTDGVRSLYENKRSGEMVRVQGRVAKVLSDDNKGSRHQRFILEVGNDLTVLVAHNIDLAERVPLQRGDHIELYGQYEWNNKGGVLHWTHHDPAKRHEEGWIEHRGTRYM